MSEIVNQSLQKIAKGTGIVFIGTMIGMFLGFIGTVIIVRYLTTSEYGLFSLALTVGIIAGISNLGIGEGATRYIAYFRGQQASKKISGVIVASVQITVIASVLCSVLVFLSSDAISLAILQNNDLSTILKILSITIPFSVLSGTVISIFRGFGVVNAKVYFNDVFLQILRISFFAAVVFLGLSLIGAVYAYLGVVVITCAALVVYAVKKVPVLVGKVRGYEPMRKELLLFSLPLFGQGILAIIIISTDKLMLGYFKTAEVVGLYSVASTLANLIPIFLTSLAFIYVPIVSQLYAKNLLDEIRRTYAVLTKWVFSAALPIFLIMFLFPDSVLNILFGARYMQAGIALQLLALGFFTHSFLGPNGMTLMVMGKTRILLVFALIQTIMNVSLNFLLIPPMGIAGAAVASAVSITTINLLASTELYLFSKTHPFTKNYLKPVVISIMLVIVISTLAKDLFTVLSIWMLVLFFILFLVAYIMLIVITRSFDKEDIDMLLAIEKRVGADFGPIKRILKKFI
ncbi:MAG: Polysaccharide biosynthesis protein [Candidatus Argoarchaeum ethanivorans]|uniref:Polysaccharide biosynthesis protein n=1 Tax=Candidatus Argoarchaeum ethanivorans TaxID=2608793 RepID=A0A811T949_9EURY|nr:MAG: Polysaccharide biosynthesis protein [Candidatus Argoarchaeum ethanivorans]